MRGLVLFAALVACRPVASPTSPPPAAAIGRAKATSELGPDVHRLIAALHSGELDDVEAWMSPRLSAALPAEALQAAGARLRSAYGDAVGILEERTHLEGRLRWYSGLVLFSDGEVVTPVLFQFAIDDRGRLDRLLVREHWFIENVKNPADGYVPITRFRFPADGEWYVMHGGRSRATNYHFGPGSQRFAYDLIMKVEGRQRRPWSRRSDNSAYYCWGHDILAPGPGTVVYVINDVQENVPPHRGEKGGNGFVIDHGFGEYSAIWHAIPGSVTVRAGDWVEPGQVVAKVGNSGRSTGPHIHFHASHRPDGWNERFGIAAEFHEVWVDGVWRPHEMPVRGQYVQNSRTRSVASRGPQVFVDL